MNIIKNVSPDEEEICEAYVHYDPDLIRDWVDTYLRNTYDVHNDYFYYFDDDGEEYLIYIEDVIDTMLFYASRGHENCSEDGIEEVIGDCQWYICEIVPLQ